MLRSVRRGVVAVAIAAVAVSLTACSAGRNAETNHPYMPASGRNVNIPSEVTYHEPFLAIRNTVLVNSVAVPSLSTLVVTFVNNHPTADALTSVSINGVPQTVPGGAIPLPSHQAVSLGNANSNYFVAVRTSAKAGDWVTVAMTFRNAARAEFRILMLPRSNEYASVPIPLHSLVRPTPLSG